MKKIISKIIIFINLKTLLNKIFIQKYNFKYKLKNQDDKMQILADVGGIPGKDCRGFCKYCYFKKVKDIKPLGCKYCSPTKIGCDKCSIGIQDAESEFKPVFLVANELQSRLMFNPIRDNNLKVNISGGGDVSCYPQIKELAEVINQFQLPMHLGYTSGKGIDNEKWATDLINYGVNEVTYTLFAADEKLRREWMGDPSPEASLKAAEIFSQNTELHAAMVIVPGVNDGEVLKNTCEKLEEWGAHAAILMRFANTTEGGLILNNAPIVKGIESQSVESFEELVKEINSEFPKLRVTGTPVCDPETGAPFAIANDGNEIYLQFIPKVTGEATIISSSIAGPKIAKIFEKINADDKVNVISTKKDIACLITKYDLEDIDLSEVKDTVLIPGRAYVHELDLNRIFSADGKERLVTRGPDTLSVDGELSGNLTDEDVIEKELEQFRDLVEAINFFGMVVPKK